MNDADHMLALEGALQELLYITNELGVALPVERWEGIASDAELTRWHHAALKAAVVLVDLALARRDRDRGGMRS